MYRIYEAVLYKHLAEFKQMIFLAGPRQVGKTTIAQHILAQSKGIYLNWDIIDHRQMILRGPDTIVNQLPSPNLGDPIPIIVLDEIHKFKDWKNYLKGFYDQFSNDIRLLVTGSSRLDIYVKGGDSLMGRYFPYSVYPIATNELISREIQEHVTYSPKEITEGDWMSLWRFGGFPDPFIKRKLSFYNRWQSLRHQQVFREDILDLSKVSDIDQLEVLAKILGSQSSQLINYSSLSRLIRISDHSIRRWFDLLESVYYVFRIKPWFKNVARSLRKEPKVYLWDWSLVKEPGARAENFIACHLLKSGLTPKKRTLQLSNNSRLKVYW